MKLKQKWQLNILTNKGKMEIKIEDHVSPEEIKEIAKYELSRQFRLLLQKETDLKRIMNNMTYDIVYKMVDSVFDNDLAAFLEGKVQEIIKNMTAFNIFNKPDAWDTETNTAYKYLQSCITENFPKIKQLVSDRIEPETMKYLKDSLSESIIEAVQDLYKTESS